MQAFLSLLRRLAGILLGLFVLGQVLFLLSANCLRLLEDAKPHLKEESSFARRFAPDWLNDEGMTHAVLTTLGRADRRWGELTGQPQSWSLFAPSVYEHIPFPCVELRWDDDRLPSRSAAGLLGTLAWRPPLEAVVAWAGADPALTAPVPASRVLPSENEPADRHRYLRFGQFRLRRFEGNVSFVLATRDRPLEVLADTWRGTIEEKLREEADGMHAYLRWRTEAFQRAHPELPPPRQVVLNLRVYRIPAPPGPEPWDWRPVFGVAEDGGIAAQPIARWLPGARPGPEYLLVEMYNPVMRRFEGLRK